MVYTPDWGTVALSIGIAVVVAAITAFVTWIFNERSNQRAFRREKLYSLKLEAYLDLLSAYDMLVSSFEVGAEVAIGELEQQVRVFLEKRGIPNGQAAVAASQFMASFGPRLQSAFWSGLGYEAPKSTSPQVQPPPPAAISPTPGDAVPQPIDMFGAWMFVFAEAQKRVDRSYAKIQLFDIQDGVVDALRKLSRKMTKFGFAGGVELMQLPAGERQKKIDALRDELEKLGDELRQDLDSTMK